MQSAKSPAPARTSLWIAGLRFAQAVLHRPICQPLQLCCPAVTIDISQLCGRVVVAAVSLMSFPQHPQDRVPGDERPAIAPNALICRTIRAGRVFAQDAIVEQGIVVEWVDDSAAPWARQIGMPSADGQPDRLDGMWGG